MKKNKNGKKDETPEKTEEIKKVISAIDESTKVSIPEIKKEETVPLITPIELINKQFPQKEGYKLKICFLWTSEEGANYFRINYIRIEDCLFESYFAKVKDGVLEFKTT